MTILKELPHNAGACHQAQSWLSPLSGAVLYLVYGSVMGNTVLFQR